MPIPFDVPTPAAAPGDLLVRPAKFRAWVDALRLDVPFESGRQLLTHAQSLAGTVLDADTRLELLEAHARAAAMLLPALEALYAGSGPPLEPAARDSRGSADQHPGVLCR